MNCNKQISSGKKFIRNASVFQTCIAWIFLIFIFGMNGFSQTSYKGISMNNNIQTKNISPGYLDKNNPVFISIKSRAAQDLKQASEKADMESSENKLLKSKIKTWPEKKRKQFQSLFEKSINDYTSQTHFDTDTFMMIFSEFGKMDLKQIADEYDLRVQSLGDNKFAAEFWEDGLAVNSEANAIKNAHELAASDYAKKHPDSGIGDISKIKETYAATRKSINNGETQRFTKVIVLLYTKEKDSSIVFHNPFQAVFDFILK